MQQQFRQSIREATNVVARMSRDEAPWGEVERLSDVCIGGLRASGRLLFADNEGSAADAQHGADKWVSRLSCDCPSQATIALTTRTSTLRATSNDSSDDHVFARHLSLAPSRSNARVFVPPIRQPEAATESTLIADLVTLPKVKARTERAMLTARSRVLAAHPAAIFPYAVPRCWPARRGPTSRTDLPLDPGSTPGFKLPAPGSTSLRFHVDRHAVLGLRRGAWATGQFKLQQRIAAAGPQTHPPIHERRSRYGQRRLRIDSHPG